MYYVYLLECRDGTLYVGSTQDVVKRVDQHSKGVGARYTRGRRPVTLKGLKLFKTRREAMAEEVRVKKLPKEGKVRYFSPG